MAFEPFPSRECLTTCPQMVQFIDQSIRDEHSKFIPSREERREILNSMSAQCSYAQCGRILTRSEAKICSRCKQARYCQKTCQTAHWRAGHKRECGEGTAKHLTLKLAERALAVPKITEYMQLHSILTLRLLEDRTNAERYVVNVQCKTQPADLMAHMTRILSQKKKDTNAQVLLDVAAFERVAIEDAPEQTRLKVAYAKELFKSGIWSDGKPIGQDSILLSIFLTSVFEVEDGKFQADGGLDGSISVTFLLPEHAMKFMGNNPQTTIRSAMFGDSKVDVDESSLRDGLNNLIRMDRENKLRLRGWPSGAKPEMQSDNLATTRTIHIP